MKPYGINRKQNIENPDVADIQALGLKSSAGRLKPEHGDDCKSYTRNAEARHKTRIHQHHVARAEGKQIVEAGVEDYFDAANDDNEAIAI